MNSSKAILVTKVNERCDQIAVACSKENPVTLFDGLLKDYTVSLASDQARFGPTYFKFNRRKTRKTQNLGFVQSQSGWKKSRENTKKLQTHCKSVKL